MSDDQDKKNVSVVVTMTKALRDDLGVIAMMHRTTLSGMVRSLINAYINQPKTQEKMRQFLALRPEDDLIRK